jgi:integrase/recombinase XerC
MNLSDIVDTLAIPPRRLPGRLDDSIEYLASTIGSPVYVRWTPAALAREYGSMNAAKAEQPDVFALLVDCETVIQFWQLGRLVALPADQAPLPGVVVERLLRAQRFRFRPTDATSSPRVDPTGGQSQLAPAQARSAQVAIEDHPWLRRTGRFVNLDSATNSLAVADDGAAVGAFLLDRAGRSSHTRRAYIADIRRLVTWCHVRGIPGPLSDLTRVELIQFRESVFGTASSSNSANHPLSASSCTRALAVVQSLYVYLLKTGYMVVNPAAELGHGTSGRADYRPSRMLPRGALVACDGWLRDATDAPAPTLDIVRQAAIVALYRWSGARLDELAHRDGYPRFRIDQDGWTLEVLGKGRKLRAIPLPDICIPFVERYRVARGLSPVPSPTESLPLIRGSRGGSLGRSGLYRQVKAALQAMSVTLPAADTACRIALQSASPHWLRHSYARALVVEQGAPLPVVQSLLGHASVQTTASYSNTDLSEARRFVAQGFPSAQEDSCTDGDHGLRE